VNQLIQLHSTTCLNYMKQLVNAVLALACLLLIVPTQFAGAQNAQKNALESISTNSLQSGKVVLKLNFKEALTSIPAGFSVTNPARIVLDLPNMANGMGKSSVDIGEGDVRTMSVIEAPSRTRVVLNLARSLSYVTAIDGKTLIMTIDTAASFGTVAETITFNATPAAANSPVRPSVRDIDFRRGANGEGRVVVELSSANIGIDTRQQGQKVLVDFIGTAIPKNLLRRLDVLDFGTPVRQIEVLEQGANTRLIIDPKGLWDFSAYQTDTQFILEVKPLKEDPNKLVQGTGYNGQKLSLNFQNIEVRALLQVIADFTELNIVTSDTVGGSLTLRLKDVPWDQALDIIMQSKNLAKRKSGNVVIVAPADELAAKEKAKLEAEAQISDLEPVRTETFQLSYSKADDVRKLLSDGGQKILSKRGAATPDARTNTLFVQDTPSKLEEVRSLIQKLDVPVRQVMIEARIVIADDKFLRELGARFGNQAGATTGNTSIGTSGSLLTTASPVANNVLSLGSSAISRGGALPAGAQPEQLNVNLPVAGAAGKLALSFLNLGNGNLVNVELQALEADNRGKVVSNPRIVTADKRKSKIFSGTEIPYLTSSPSGGTTVAFKAAVLSLDVTPQITPDDKIQMELEIKKDSVGLVISGVPSIDTNGLNTQILVDNGDTAVLGGIFEQTTRTDVTKVPWLGDIPLLGNLFKNTRKIEDRKELLIFITPKIVKDQLAIR
jgi:type IV pilus assembly protein PilQ